MRAALTLAIAATALVCAVAVSAQEKKSVKAGVYTAAQADRGTAVFRSKCASCHAPNAGPRPITLASSENARSAASTSFA